MGIISHYFRWILITATTLPIVLLVGFSLFLAPSSVYAQLSDTTIAKTYLISGNTAEFGDLVSFDRTTQVFRLAQQANDSNLFGVVVNNPTIVLRTTAESVPIVSSGEVDVQVTTINGPISAGDFITSSSIPGKGQKAGPSASFIAGIALDSFPVSPSGVSTGVSTSTVDGGTIRVLLAIGPKSLSGGGLINGAGPMSSSLNVLGVSMPLATLIKYFLAAIVVVGSIYVAFRNFGSSMKDSIISVGRNPLAKSSIQSMVVLNTVLIVLISGVGLFVGLLILFVQL